MGSKQEREAEKKKRGDEGKSGRSGGRKLREGKQRRVTEQEREGILRYEGVMFVIQERAEGRKRSRTYS